MLLLCSNLCIGDELAGICVPDIIIDSIEIKHQNRPCIGNKNQVFWQHKGFTESSHGQYESRLINVDEVSPDFGLFHWMNSRYNLESCKIELTAEAKSDKPLKNELKIYIYGFDMKTKLDSIQVLTSQLSSEWEKINWTTNWDQGESYLSYLFQLNGESSIQLRDINFKITLNDTVIDHFIDLKDRKVSEISNSAIQRSYGYEYSVNSEEAILTIARIDSLNNKLLYGAYPNSNDWTYSTSTYNVHYGFPVSMNKKRYIKNIPKIEKKFVGSAMKYNDVIGTKMSAVIKVYSVIRYFFPYKEEIGLEPVKYLRKYLNLMESQKSDFEVYNTLKQMVAELEDGHGYVAHDMGYKSRCIEADFDYVQENVIVAGSALEELKIGDIIIQIDGKAVEDLLTERMAKRSGSKQWKLYRETMLIGCEENAKPCELIYVRNLDTMTCILNRSGYAGANIKKTYPAVKEVKEDIYYIDLGRTSYDEFYLATDSLISAKGIIFDLREYPTMTPELLSHLTTTTIQSALWQTPLQVANKRQVTYDTTGRWEIKPKLPFLDCKIVFLIGSKVISYGESLLGIIDYYNLGTTVGEKSAGVNGNKTQFKTPGGFTVYFTGMKVEQHDGRQLFTKGVLPDVKWTVNASDYANKMDLLIEYATSIINDE